MFGVKNAELSEGSVYLKPGIQKVTVVNLITEVRNDKPVMVLSLKPMGEDDKNKTDFVMYCTEKALSLSMNQIYEIALAIDPALESIEAGSLDEYVSKLAPKIKNKSYVQKLIGNQSKEGGIFYARLPLSRKTQKDPKPTIAVGLNTEVPFTFDEENQYDMQAFKGSGLNSSSNLSSSDLPSWPTD